MQDFPFCHWNVILETNKAFLTALHDRYFQQLYNFMIIITFQLLLRVFKEMSKPLPHNTPQDLCICNLWLELLASCWAFKHFHSNLHFGNCFLLNLQTSVISHQLRKHIILNTSMTKHIKQFYRQMWEGRIPGFRHVHFSCSLKQNDHSPGKLKIASGIYFLVVSRHAHADCEITGS